jgi:cell shape-determining protein MreC
MRFNHVFFVLLLLSTVSAFALPRRATDGARPGVGLLLTPVARPVSALAGYASNRVSPVHSDDPRSRDELVDENTRLRQQLIRLESELSRLEIAAAEKAKYTDDVTQVAVAGSAPGQGDGLLLQGSTMTGLQSGMFALHDQAVVGTLVSGRGGTQVRLVTDPQTRVQAYFVSFRQSGRSTSQPSSAGTYVKLPLGIRLVEGRGGNLMVCRNIPMEDIKTSGLQKGDWVVVDDADWAPVQHRRIGVVSEIRDSGKLMAEIVIKPEVNLLRLSRVMVLKPEN